MNEKIANKTQEQIRKAYFKRELPQLLNEIQAEGLANEDNLKELESYLELLRHDEVEVRTRLNKYIEDDALKPPSVEELQGKMTDEQKQRFDAWKIEVEKGVKRSKEIMDRMRQSVVKGDKVKREDWLDAGLEIATLTSMIDQDRVYKDQMYRAVMTRIIDGYGVSRAEAEERAKLTKEYRDYKIAVLFKENLEEFIMLCKKYYSNV